MPTKKHNPTDNAEVTITARDIPTCAAIVRSPAALAIDAANLFYFTCKVYAYYA